MYKNLILPKFISAESREKKKKKGDFLSMLSFSEES